MKISEIRAVLSRFADIAHLEENSSFSDALQVLAESLKPPRDATVAATLKKLGKVDLESGEATGGIATGVTCQ